jgi:hypothetical protein
MRCTRATWPASTASDSFEHVVAGDVQDRGLDLLEAQFAGRVQQRQLLDLLVRREQVALDAIGEELQGALALLARRDALVLLRQALAIHCGNAPALDRLQFDRDPVAFQRGRTRRLLRLEVQPGQQHQGEGAVVAGGAFAICCRACCRLLARLAGGDAELDDLLVREQAQRAAGASTAPQSKWAPATACTVRSV